MKAENALLLLVVYSSEWRRRQAENVCAREAENSRKDRGSRSFAISRRIEALPALARLRPFAKVAYAVGTDQPAESVAVALAFGTLLTRHNVLLVPYGKRRGDEDGIVPARSHDLPRQPRDRHILGINIHRKAGKGGIRKVFRASVALRKVGCPYNIRRRRRDGVFSRSSIGRLGCGRVRVLGGFGETHGLARRTGRVHRVRVFARVGLGHPFVKYVQNLLLSTYRPGRRDVRPVRKVKRVDGFGALWIRPAQPCVRLFEACSLLCLAAHTALGRSVEVSVVVVPTIVGVVIVPARACADSILARCAVVIYAGAGVGAEVAAAAAALEEPRL